MRNNYLRLVFIVIFLTIIPAIHAQVERSNPTSDYIFNIADGFNGSGALTKCRYCARRIPLDNMTDHLCWTHKEGCPEPPQHTRQEQPYTSIDMGNGNSIKTYGRGRIGTSRGMRKNTREASEDATNTESSSPPRASRDRDTSTWIDTTPLAVPPPPIIVAKTNIEQETPAISGKEFEIRNHIKVTVIITYRLKNGTLKHKSIEPWQGDTEAPTILLEENQEIWPEAILPDKKSKRMVRREPIIIKNGWKIDLWNPEDPDLPRH